MDLDSKEADAVRDFLRNLYSEFEGGEYLHYKPKLKRVGNKWVKVPLNLDDHRTFRTLSKNTEKEEDEAPTSCLMGVVLLSSKDWQTFLKEQFDALLSRTWQFREKLKKNIRQIL